MYHGAFAVWMQKAIAYYTIANLDICPFFNIILRRKQEQKGVIPMEIKTGEVHGILQKYRNRKSALLAVLQDIQEKFNWLPEPVLRMVSEELCIPLIDIYSVATFYRAFSLVPRGKHLCTVCLGTACHVRGAPIVLSRVEDKLGIEAGCTTKDEEFTLETVNCLGACALAPIVVIDGKYHGQTTVQKVDFMFSEIKKATKIKKTKTASKVKTKKIKTPIKSKKKK
jgi:NADH-quinone oxidoreductase subunit E